MKKRNNRIKQGFLMEIEDFNNKRKKLKKKIRGFFIFIRKI